MAKLTNLVGKLANMVKPRHSAMFSRQESLIALGISARPNVLKRTKQDPWLPWLVLLGAKIISKTGLHKNNELMSML